MNEILNIILVNGGLALVGGAIWTLINIRAKRRAESAKSMQQEAQASKICTEVKESQLEIDRTQIDWMIQKLKEQDEYRRRMERIVYGLQRSITYLFGLLQKEELYHCENMTCQKRNPALGTFKNTIPDWLKEMLEEISNLKS